MNAKIKARANAEAVFSNYEKSVRLKLNDSEVPYLGLIDGL